MTSLKGIWRGAGLLLLFAALGLGGADSAGAANGADTETTLYDGVQSCSELFGLFEICTTADGIEHFTQTPSGNYISWFMGERTIEVYALDTGELLFAQTFSGRQFLNFNIEDGVRVSNVEACIDLGTFAIRIDTHIAGGNIVKNTFEIVDSCD